MEIDSNRNSKTWESDEHHFHQTSLSPVHAPNLPTLHDVLHSHIPHTIITLPFLYVDSSYVEKSLQLNLSVYKENKLNEIKSSINGIRINDKIFFEIPNV